MPPEFAGFTSTLNMLIPLVASIVASLTPLAMRQSPTPGTAVRMTVLNLLVVGVTGRWVVRREALAGDVAQPHRSGQDGPEGGVDA